MEKSEMSLGGVLFILFVIMPLSVIFSGYVITVLWDWFIVTTFAMKALTIPQALGLSLIISYLTLHQIQKDERDWSEKLGIAIAKPLVYLLIGWIVHLFI
jgi:hypothetical protein